MITPLAVDLLDFQEMQISVDQLGFTWLGQGGYLYRTAEKINLCVDPYLSNSVTRLKGLHRITPIPLQPDDLSVDTLLITHAHLDHLDPDTLPSLFQNNPEAIVIAPPDCVSALIALGAVEDKITALEHGQRTRQAHFSILATPAFHMIPANGYLLELPQAKIYLTGDTEYDSALLIPEIEDIDLMFVCINGKLGNMSAEQAAMLTKEIQPRLVIPMHYGLFLENTVDPQEFVKALKLHTPESAYEIIQVARPHLFSKTLG